MPSSHFYDLLASFGTPLGDGAVDRRLRSKSEAAVGISGRGFDRLVLRRNIFEFMKLSLKPLKSGRTRFPHISVNVVRGRTAV